jgi:hypothetical protein
MGQGYRRTGWHPRAADDPGLAPGLELIGGTGGLVMIGLGATLAVSGRKN